MWQERLLSNDARNLGECRHQFALACALLSPCTSHCASSQVGQARASGKVAILCLVHQLASVLPGMAAQLESLPSIQDLDEIRGAEGQAASCYFSAFGSLITREKSDFG